MTYFS